MYCLSFLLLLLLPSLALALSIPRQTTSGNVTISANTTASTGLACALKNTQCCAAIGLATNPVILDVLNGFDISAAQLGASANVTIGVDCETVPSDEGQSLLATCDASLVCCTGATFEAGTVMSNCTRLPFKSHSTLKNV